MLIPCETVSSSEDDAEWGLEGSEEGEESGLGLLARFAASVLPVASTSATLLSDSKHRRMLSTLGKHTLDW